MKTYWIAFGIFAVVIAPLSARTVYSDSFTGETTGANPSGWYSISTITGGAPTIQTANNGTVSGNTTYWGWNNSAIVSNFSAVTLSSVGDYITVSYDYVYGGTLATTPVAVLGLYNSSGTYQTTNLTSGVGSTSDDIGYKIYKIKDSTADFTLSKVTSGGPANYYNATGTTVSTSDSGITTALSTVYNISLKIQLDSATTYAITYTLNGATFTTSSVAAVTYTFDEVAACLFGGGGAQQGYLDNVLITTNVAAVPEPSTYSMLIVGAVLWGYVALLKRRCLIRESK